MRVPRMRPLAHEFNLPTTQVTNYLSWARKRFRQHVLDTVRSLTGSDEEYQGGNSHAAWCNSRVRFRVNPEP